MALGLTNKDYIGKLSGCGFVVINMVVLFIIKRILHGVKSATCGGQVGIIPFASASL